MDSIKFIGLWGGCFLFIFSIRVYIKQFPMFGTNLDFRLTKTYMTENLKDCVGLCIFTVDLSKVITSQLGYFFFFFINRISVFHRQIMTYRKLLSMYYIRIADCEVEDFALVCVALSSRPQMQRNMYEFQVHKLLRCLKTFRTQDNACLTLLEYR